MESLRRRSETCDSSRGTKDARNSFAYPFITFTTEAAFYHLKPSNEALLEVVRRAHERDQDITIHFDAMSMEILSARPV